MIKVGDSLPSVTLYESETFDQTTSCPSRPNKADLKELVGSKKTVIFGVPAAFTPTCSSKHVPGYLQHLDDFKALGVEQIICVSVNDAYVMFEWKKATKAEGIRFLGDGEAELAIAAGLDTLIPGMGRRCKRFSMLVVDGKVQHLNVEPSGQFGVSSAEHLLSQVVSKH